MKNILIGEKILISRREIGFSQETLARVVGVSTRTIVRIEKDSKTNLGLLNKIAQSVNKPLSYFISEEELDKNAIKELKGSHFQVESGKKSENYTILSYEILFKSNNINPLYKKGEYMFKVNVEDSDNDPQIIFGDKLLINTYFNVEHDRYYLVKDGKERKVILRQLKEYGNKRYLRTKNLRFEDELTDRFKFVGKIINLERVL